MRLFKKLFSFFWDRSLLIFLIIGGLNTLVSMVGSQLLYGALGYWGATALMFTVCSVFSFIFNRKYSFESKAPLLQSAVRFSVVIAVCYLISFGLSDFLVPMFMGRFFPAVSTSCKQCERHACAIGGAGPETGLPAAFSRRAPFHHSRRGAPAALKAPARVSSSS